MDESATGNQDTNDADDLPLVAMAVVIEHKLLMTVKTVMRMEVVLPRLG